MKILTHEALWLLVLLPCLVGAYLFVRRRRHVALRYSHLGLIRPALAGHHPLRPHVPATILLAAVTLCVLALSRPSGMIDTPANERTIVLAIDVSMSMAAEDIKPNRLVAAQAAARSFIARQPDDVRIAILAFAGHALLVQPPTIERNKALEAIDHLGLQFATAVGSGIVGALMTLFPDDDFAEAFDVFSAPMRFEPDNRVRIGRSRHRQPEITGPGTHPSAAIVVLTDGADTGGVPGERAARFAAERGVRVYTVGFGKPGLGGAAPAGDGFDEKALKRIAEITHGEYFPATTAKQLDAVYRQLPGHVVLRAVHTEFAAVLAAAAAMLVIVGGVLSFMWNGPLPFECRAGR